MTKNDKKHFFAHLKDGMLKFCICLLRTENPRTQDYAFLYGNLCTMIISMQQNIGPLSDELYYDFINLNVPLYNEKGGVCNE